MNSMKMIGLVNQVNDLYKFMMNTKPSIISTPLQHASLESFPHKHVNTTHNFPFLSIIPYNSLWHFKLGHLSNSRLCDMEKLDPSIINDNKYICDICYFAKQNKKFLFQLVIQMHLLSLNFVILTFGAQLRPHQFMAINTF